MEKRWKKQPLDVRFAARSSVVAWIAGSGNRNGLSGAAFRMEVAGAQAWEWSIPSIGLSTANRALLGAVIGISDSAGSGSTVEVRTNSQYISDILRTDLDHWVDNGWKKSDGREVLNRDMLEHIAIIRENKGLKFASKRIGDKDEADTRIVARLRSLADSTRKLSA